MPSSLSIATRFLSVSVERLPALATLLALGLSLSVGTVHAAYNVTLDAGASAGGSWSGNTWSAHASGATVAVDEIETRLASGDVAIDTGAGGAEAGRISITVPLSWNANRLTLIAAGDVRIEAVLSASADAALTLSAGGEVFTAYAAGTGFTGRIDFPADGSGALVIDGEPYLVVTDAAGFYAAIRDGAAAVALGADIALAPIASFAGTVCEALIVAGQASASFCPFTYAGRLNGLGHVVDQLAIDIPYAVAAATWSGGYGLFGTLDGATVANLALTGASVATVNAEVGLLAGTAGNAAAITNTHVAGAVQGSAQVGGLVGTASASRIEKVSAAVMVTIAAETGSGLDVGGLVGRIDGATRVGHADVGGSVVGAVQVGGLVGRASESGILDSHSTVDVEGNVSVGGLVGAAGAGASLLRTSAAGAVTGTQGVGGLVGVVDSGGAAIRESAASGAVTARGRSNARFVGGLLGGGNADTLVNDSYSLSPVSGAVSVGGLVGELPDDAFDRIRSAYAAGSVSAFSGAVGGPTDIGGLLGSGSADSASASFWDADASGQSGSASGTGKSTAEMQQDITFIAAGWDFSYLWAIAGTENQGYPFFGQRACGSGLALTTTPTPLWQMLALPCVPAAADPTVANTWGNAPAANLPAADYGIRWAVNGRDASTGRNLRLAADSEPSPGAGYWIRSLDAPVDGVLAVIEGTGTEVTDTSEDCTSVGGCVAVAFHGSGDPVGLALVGNPLPYDIDWSLVRVRANGVDLYTPAEAEAANLLSNQVWVWNGVAYDTGSDAAPTRGDLRYFKSFWVEVLPGAAGTDLELLLPAQSSDGGEPVPGVGEWRVRLTASNPATGWEASVQLGQWSGAETDHDAADLRALAPYASPYISLALPHADWGDEQGDYATDFRPADGLPALWDLNLRANPSRLALLLSWDGDAAVLARSRLIDGSRVINLADYPDGYTVNLTGKLRRLRWEYLGAAD